MNRRLIAMTTALAVGLTTATAAPIAVAQEASANTDATDIIISPGSDETRINLAWRTSSLNPSAEFVQWAPSAAIVDGAFPEDASTSEATRRLGGAADYHNAATITGLKENTEYSYRLGSDDRGWSQVHTFDTESFGDDWNFLFVGDPQVGASGNLDKDTEGWLAATKAATAQFPDSSLLHSGGDQVNIAVSRDEYTSFFGNPTLRELPTSVVRGNHEKDGTLYDRMYNMPNGSNDNYWYEHNNALFVSLDSNNSDIEAHKTFLRETISAHGADKDWIILSFHHAPYSQGTHHDDGNLTPLREELAPAISELGVDAVLSGHDHIYTRSHLMNGNEPVLPTEGATGAERAGKPGDVLHPKDGEALYITGSSSSGSKFYDFMAKDGTRIEDATVEETFAQDQPLDSTAWWNQDRTPDYTNIEVTPEKLTLTTYNVADNSVVDEVTLAKGASDEPEQDDSSSEGSDVLAGSDELSSGSSSDLFSDSDARVWLGIAGAVGAIGIVAGLLSPQVRAQVSKFFGGRR